MENEIRTYQDQLEWSNKQLRAENERLKKALEKIYRLYIQEEYHLTALNMAKVAQQALNEVTK